MPDQGAQQARRADGDVPYHGGPISTASRQAGAVVVVYNAVHAAGVRRDVPHIDRPVARSGRQLLPVGTEGDGFDEPTVATEREQALAALGIPHDRGSIGAGARDARAV